jgi:hypothetical protein
MVARRRAVVGETGIIGVGVLDLLAGVDPRREGGWRESEKQNHRYPGAHRSGLSQPAGLFVAAERRPVEHE